MTGSVVVDQDWADALVEILSESPEVFIASVIAGLLAAAAVIGSATYAISQAGKFQPPVVVLSVVVGLVAIIAIVAAVLSPANESLAVAAGTAVGALAGALGTAFQTRHKEKEEDTDA